MREHNFVVIAVAEESRGAETARQWIDLAQPSYPVLIDREHRVADLYNMVNVPQAVWIDEHGHIVRPTETAGSHDAWRARNRADGSIADSALALGEQAKHAYRDAVRDWAMHGAASRHAYSAQQTTMSRSPTHISVSVFTCTATAWPRKAMCSCNGLRIYVPSPGTSTARR